MMPVEVSSVKKSYGSRKAVDGVSFSVDKGEIFALLGPNGAGKTTLIEIMEGLRRRDEGTIRILGFDPWDSGSLLNRIVGVMPQNFTFFGESTPREAVKYYATLFGVSADPDAILEEVMLEDSATVRYQDLSGGQKQKVGLALSIVNSPELLFLDEPTTGLDPNSRRAIWDVIRGLKAKGKTVILTTHYLDEAQQLSDRVSILDHGKIVAMGTSDEIIVKYGSGESLEIHGSETLAAYLKTNTNLKVEYDDRGLVRVALNQKTDAIDALDAVKESGLDWGEIHTHEDSLEDVFVKLVRGTMDEQGEIKTAHENSSINGLKETT
ncbi:MAG TPA: ABC transporter ATP-binding protein [Candidatus Limnocylindrales bacterium]|nr:ABC transporter ATP-binding protein [Candidatus Limnocylindrales bacterium]